MYLSEHALHSEESPSGSRLTSEYAQACRIYSSEIPTISRPIPHHSESPGRTASSSVTIPEVVSDQPAVELLIPVILAPVGYEIGLHWKISRSHPLVHLPPHDRTRQEKPDMRWLGFEPRL